MYCLKVLGKDFLNVGNEVYRAQIGKYDFEILHLGGLWFADSVGGPTTKDPKLNWEATPELALHKAIALRMNHIWNKVADLEKMATDLRKDADSLQDFLGTKD